jgi:hypothetical protein
MIDGQFGILRNKQLLWFTRHLVLCLSPPHSIARQTLVGQGHPESQEASGHRPTS